MSEVEDFEPRMIRAMLAMQHYMRSFTTVMLLSAAHSAEDPRFYATWFKEQLERMMDTIPVQSNGPHAEAARELSGELGAYTCSIVLGVVSKKDDDRHH